MEKLEYLDNLNAAMDFDTRKEIRLSYRFWTPRSDPYKYADWIRIFTPIEDNVWADIRYLGLPFYPQFPVGPYFIDFADPFKKIGIEVDGKEFHSEKENLKWDAHRQRELEKYGWKIFRIAGRQTYKSYEDYDEDDERFFKDCSEGILAKIRENYYGRKF